MSVELIERREMKKKCVDIGLKKLQGQASDAGA